MKWLKLSCPFGGKQYPIYVALAVLVISAVTLVNTNVSSPLELALLAVLISLIVCWYIEQRLTPEERSMCAGKMPPLWEPVSMDILEDVRAQTNHISREASGAMMLAGAMALRFFMPRRGYPNPQAGWACLFLVGIIFVLDLFRRMLWKKADSSAVCTIIQIDHMYSVTHRSRRRTWEVDYLVFYQPDGRYILKAKAGSGETGKIAVVKYHGMVTWVPCVQPVQSQNGFYY